MWSTTIAKLLRVIFVLSLYWNSFHVPSKSNFVCQFLQNGVEGLPNAFPQPQKQPTASPATTAAANNSASATLRNTAGSGNNASNVTITRVGKTTNPVNRALVDEKGAIGSQVIKTILGPLTRRDIDNLVNDSSKFNFKMPIIVGCTIGGGFLIVTLFIVGAALFKR
jgi:hypothetical protein